MRRHQGGLILGRSLHESEPVGFHTQKYCTPEDGTLITYNGDGHLMTIAPTGTGKTSGPVISNALHHPGQLIVLDIKGEVHRITARTRREIGPVHVIDLRDDYEGQDCINPIELTYLGGSEIGVLARTLASDLVVRTGQEKEPFWNDWAETLIAGALSHVMEDCPYEKMNLSHVFDIFHNDDVKYGLAVMLDSKVVRSKSAHSAFAALLQINADQTFGGILSTTQQHLRLFGSDLVKRLTSNTSVDLPALIAGEPMTIYIIVPPHRLRLYRPLLRTLLSGLLTLFTLRKNLPPHRTLMLCDEIGNLGYLEAFVTAATLLRASGVTMWSFWQNFAQLEQYGHDARTMLDNAGVIQLFGCRNFRMAQDFVDVVGGISADEIMRLPPDEQLLLIEGGLPTRAKAVRYYKEPIFARLYDKNPVPGR
jgi:type IV secretion system protein VirD4